MWPKSDSTRPGHWKHKYVKDNYNGTMICPDTLYIRLTQTDSDSTERLYEVATSRNVKPALMPYTEARHLQGAAKKVSPRVVCHFPSDRLEL